MRTLLLFSFTILITFNVFAQKEKEPIAVGQIIINNDTIRLFTLEAVDRDKHIEALIKKWGVPSSNKTGIIKWEDISIDGIDSKLEIKLSDGLFAEKTKSALYTPFKNEKDKTKRLNSLKENESRYTYLEFMGSDGINYINSAKREKIIVDMLLAEFKKLK